MKGKTALRSPKNHSLPTDRFECRFVVSYEYRIFSCWTYEFRKKVSVLYLIKYVYVQHRIILILSILTKLQILTRYSMIYNIYLNRKNR